MKEILNYMACATAISVAVVLTLSGGWLTVAGVCVASLVWVSGEIFQRAWKMFWVSNMKIMKHFNLL